MRADDILTERMAQAKAIINGDWNTISELARSVKDHGGTQIGHGKFSIAYMDRSYGKYVVKVVHKWDQPFLDYIEFCSSHSSPYLLKVVDHRAVRDEFFVAVTERLRPVHLGTHFKRLKRTVDMLSAGGWEPVFDPNHWTGESFYMATYQSALHDHAEGDNSDANTAIRESVSKPYPGLEDILFKIGNMGHSLDLHLGNWGARGKQLVLLDPLFDEDNLKTSDRFGSGFSGGI